MHFVLLDILFLFETVKMDDSILGSDYQVVERGMDIIVVNRLSDLQLGRVLDLQLVNPLFQEENLEGIFGHGADDFECPIIVLFPDLRSRLGLRSSSELVSVVLDY